VVPAQGARDEIDGLVDSFIGLGATEPKEAAAGLAEAFATQASNAEIVIGPFEEIECQAVRADAQSVACRTCIGKDIEGAGGTCHAQPIDSGQPGAESLNFAAKPVHVVIAGGRVVLEGGLGRPLRQGGAA